MQPSEIRLSSSEEFKGPSTLGVMLFFHLLSIVKSLVLLKSIGALHNPGLQTGTTIALVNPMIVMVFSALCRVVRLPPLSKGVAPYIMFDPQLAWFTVFYSH